MVAKDEPVLLESRATPRGVRAGKLWSGERGGWESWVCVKADTSLGIRKTGLGEETSVSQLSGYDAGGGLATRSVACVCRLGCSDLGCLLV
ncbi:hypothetical protein MRX96_041770 [Rhipicephalus microplus]